MHRSYRQRLEGVITVKQRVWSGSYWSFKWNNEEAASYSSFRINMTVKVDSLCTVDRFSFLIFCFSYVFFHIQLILYFICKWIVYYSRLDFHCSSSSVCFLFSTFKCGKLDFFGPVCVPSLSQSSPSSGMSVFPEADSRGDKQSQRVMAETKQDLLYKHHVMFVYGGLDRSRNTPSQLWRPQLRRHAPRPCLPVTRFLQCLRACGGLLELEGLLFLIRWVTALSSGERHISSRRAVWVQKADLIANRIPDQFLRCGVFARICVFCYRFFLNSFGWYWSAALDLFIICGSEPPALKCLNLKRCHNYPWRDDCSVGGQKRSIQVSEMGGKETLNSRFLIFFYVTAHTVYIGMQETTQLSSTFVFPEIWKNLKSMPTTIIF